MSADSMTLADLQDQLGGIELERILLKPSPGSATEQDLLDRVDRDGPICELVDGVLVAKPMGNYESLVAVEIIHMLRTYLDTNDLGFVLGADGTLRLLPGLVRLPDVSFIRWDRFVNRELPSEPIPDLAPDLAIEVLSKSNTEAEMNRKLQEYFAAGVKLVWIIDPQTRTAKAYTSETEWAAVDTDGSLDGGDVLPGFVMSLAKLFSKAGRPR